MTRISKRLLQWVGACVAAMALGPAFAQISNVTDGATTSTSCTSYQFNAQGVLRFSPDGCLAGAPPPPPPVPAFTFDLATATVLEDAGITTVKVRRTGTDLTTAGTITVGVTGGTAGLGTNYALFVPPFSAATLSVTLNFPAEAAGVTLTEQSFGVGIINASQPAGGSKTVDFSLTSPSGGTLGGTSVHSLRITSTLPPPTSGDIAIDGTVIPDSVPVGTYLPRIPLNGACEFAGQAGFPGFGPNSPCGSYEIPVGNCNSGMIGGIQNDGFNTENVVNRAFMFVHEEMRVGNTFLGGSSMRYPQHKNHAFVMKFKTGSAGQFPPVTPGSLPAGGLGVIGFDFADMPNRGATDGDRFATISRTPCDFSYTKVDAGQTACYRPVSAYYGNKIIAQIMTPGSPADANACELNPDTVYYLNIRWESPLPATRGKIGCHSTQYCGTSLGIL